MVLGKWGEVWVWNIAWKLGISFSSWEVLVIPWRDFAKVLLIGWLIAWVCGDKNSHEFFSFRLSKVKFWGLIFQSGPGNWESTFWKTAAVKFEKVKLLPLCHRTLWSNWTAHRSWKNGFYILHWKRSGKYLLDNIFIWWFWILTYVLRRFRQVLNEFSIFFCCPRKANFNFSALFWLWVSVYFHQNTIF